MPMIGALVGLFDGATQAALDARVTALEAEDVVLDGRLDTAEGDIDDLEATDVVLDGRLDTAEIDIDALEAAIGDWTFVAGAVDPTAGGGVAAAVPALYFRTSDNTYWVKTGAANTAWLQDVTATFSGNMNVTGTVAVTGGITATTTIAATGNMSAARFLAGADSVGAPGFSWTGDDNTGVYSEGAGIVSVSGDAVRYLRASTGGVDVLNTLFSASARVIFSGTISPTTLSANADNYNPTGLANAVAIRQDATTPVSITGLQGGTGGRLIFFTNISSSTITLANESGSSTAANRFALAGGVDLILVTGDIVVLRYDATSSRWRVVD